MIVEKTPVKPVKTGSLRATEWRERNPERSKENNARYLINNRELVLLRQKLTWLFSKKGKGHDVDGEIANVKSSIADYLFKREGAKTA